MDEDEIETIAHSNEEKTEFTYVIKSTKKLSNSDVILELEYLINEMARAEDQMSRPGVSKH